MTDKTVVGAVTAVAAVVGGVSGISSAPTYPFETMNESPFAVTYPMNGGINIGPVGSRKNLLNIAIDVLIPRRDLAADLEVLEPFLDTIPAALLAELSYSGDIFSAAIDTLESIAFEFLPEMNYGGVQMIGYRFILQNVKLLVSV